MKAKSLALISQHSDLLSADKQAVARWLCEEWAQSPSSAPKWLQRRFRQTFSFPLHNNDAPQKMLKDLTLELLSQHRDELADRARRSGRLPT